MYPPSLVVARPCAVLNRCTADSLLELGVYCCSLRLVSLPYTWFITSSLVTAAVLRVEDRLGDAKDEFRVDCVVAVPVATDYRYRASRP
jgi:hypothetical protein